MKAILAKKKEEEEEARHARIAGEAGSGSAGQTCRARRACRTPARCGSGCSNSGRSCSVPALRNRAKSFRSRALLRPLLLPRRYACHRFAAAGRRRGCQGSRRYHSHGTPGGRCCATPGAGGGQAACGPDCARRKAGRQTACCRSPRSKRTDAAGCRRPTSCCAGCTLLKTRLLKLRRRPRFPPPRRSPQLPPCSAGRAARRPRPLRAAW